MTRQDAPTQWECGYCGYRYDPAKGDPEHGIAPGTPFADLPEGWSCPLCESERDDFTPAGA